MKNLFLFLVLCAAWPAGAQTQICSGPSGDKVCVIPDHDTSVGIGACYHFTWGNNGAAKSRFNIRPVGGSWAESWNWPAAGVFNSGEHSSYCQQSNGTIEDPTAIAAGTEYVFRADTYTSNGTHVDKYQLRFTAWEFGEDDSEEGQADIECNTETVVCGLTVTAKKDTAVVSWKSVDDADEYTIKTRQKGSAWAGWSTIVKDSEKQTNSGILEYKWSGLEADKTHVFRIETYYDDGSRGPIASKGVYIGSDGTPPAWNHDMKIETAIITENTFHDSVALSVNWQGVPYQLSVGSDADYDKIRVTWQVKSGFSINHSTSYYLRLHEADGFDPSGAYFLDPPGTHEPLYVMLPTTDSNGEWWGVDKYDNVMAVVEGCVEDETRGTLCGDPSDPIYWIDGKSNGKTDSDWLAAKGRILDIGISSNGNNIRLDWDYPASFSSSWTGYTVSVQKYSNNSNQAVWNRSLASNALDGYDIPTNDAGVVPGDTLKAWITPYIGSSAVTSSRSNTVYWIGSGVPGVNTIKRATKEEYKTWIGASAAGKANVRAIGNVQSTSWGQIKAIIRERSR